MGPIDSPEVEPVPASHAVAVDASAQSGQDQGQGPGQRQGPEPGPPFANTKTDEGAELRLASWPLGELARLENLVVTYPALDSDAGDPTDRLPNRRGRLVEVAIRLDRDQLAQELERPAVRARLAAAGISDLRVGP